MVGETGYLKRLQVEVALPDLEAAVGLRSRLEELFWRRVPPVVERVCAACAPAGLHVRIDRVELDLGWIPPDRLEQDTLLALEAALAQALADAITAARIHPSEDAHTISPVGARLAELEAYLATGTLPSAVRGAPFDAESLLLDMAGAQPDALVSMLRRRAGDGRTLDRVVLRLGEEGLRALLAVLAPGHAAAILNLLEDVLLVQRTEEVRSTRLASESDLRRLTWVTTLEFLLRDAGTQFNRRRLLRFLLEREALRSGLAYAALLELMAIAAERAERRSPLRSSLPGTLMELLAEHRSAPQPWAAAGAGPATSPPDDGTHVAEVLFRAVSSGRADQTLLAELLAAAPLSSLDVQIRRLDPDNADTILTILEQVTAREGRRLGVSGKPGSDKIRRLARLAALAFLAESGDTGFSPAALGQAVADALASHVQGTGSVAAQEDPSPEAWGPGQGPKGRSGWGDGNGTAWPPAGGPPHRGDQGHGGGAASRVHPPAAREGASASGGTGSPLPAGAWPASRPRGPSHAAGGGAASHDAPSGEATGRSGQSGEGWRDRGGPSEPSETPPDGLAPLDPYGPRMPAPAPSEGSAIPLPDRAALGGATRVAAGLLPTDPATSGLSDHTGPGHRDMEFPDVPWDQAPGNAVASAPWVAGTLSGDGHFPDRDRPPDPSPDLCPATDAVEGLLHQAEAFLRHGHPRRACLALGDLARDEPGRLARRIVAAARGAPGGVADVARRLSGWLLPAELSALLGEDPGSGPVLAALSLARQGPIPPLPSLGTVPAIEAVALAAEWLATGVVPSSAPVGVGRREMEAALDRLDAASLTVLFLVGDGSRSRPSFLLSRAATLLGEGAARRLAGRLGPWVDAELADALVKAAGRAQPGRLPVGQIPPAARGTGVRPPRVAGEAAAPEDGAAAVLAWLDGRDVVDAASMPQRFAMLSDKDDPALLAYLTGRRGSAAARRRWAAALPEATLARLACRLAPSEGRLLADAVLLIGAAWRQTAPFGAKRPEPRLLWATLLDQIAAPRPLDVAGIVGRLMDSLAAGDQGRKARLAARAGRLARDAGHVTLRTALRLARRRDTMRAKAARTEPSPPPPATRGAPAPDRRPPAAAVPDTCEPVFIANAGLVLFNPYLPTLFERLGLVPAPRADGRRVGIGEQDPATLTRAVHLLQYLADGRLDAPEPELVLNKLLCGQAPAVPVARRLEAGPEDLALCDGLMDAVLANWPGMQNTNADGLRETFLQREGRLRHVDGQWQLKVQRRTLDVLTDRIPWSFAVVYHKWMREPIHVTW